MRSRIMTRWKPRTRARRSQAIALLTDATAAAPEFRDRLGRTLPWHMRFESERRNCPNVRAWKPASRGSEKGSGTGPGENFVRSAHFASSSRSIGTGASRARGSARASVEPQDPDPAVHHGRHAWKRRAMGGGIRIFEAARSERNSSSPALTASSSSTCGHRATLPAADRALDVAVRQWPQHPQIWRTRLAYLMYSGRPAEALAILENPTELPLELKAEYVDGGANDRRSARRPPASRRGGQS